MGAIGDIFFRALFEDSQFSAEAKRVGTKMGNTAGMTMGQRMGASLGKSLNQNLGRGVGNAANNIGKMVVAGTAVAIGGLVGATKAAIDFEDAFAGIRKTVDETDLKAAGLTFESLSDSIRKMAREIPIAATELAAIGEAAGALGIRGQDIEKFTEVVAKLSVTTDLTSEQAATALGQLGTTLHLTGGEFLEFADTLVALGNAGASTESQIVDMASRFAAAGNSAGLSKEEVLALSSAVASMGIDVEAGGTALSQTFNNITTGIGTASGEAKTFADTLGLSAAQFKEAWRRDALGTFEDFLQELNKLDEFEQANILDKVGITGQRQLNAVKLMAQNVGFVNDQLKISRTATGALGEEAAKKFATTAMQIQLLKNNLTDVGITIGNAVLPTITKMIGQFSTFLNDPKTQVGIKEFAVNLGKAVEGAAQWVSRLDFNAIAGSLKLAAGFAKGLLSAFMSAPQWLQAAVVTGWGLNKLTGGAVGSIFSDLLKTAFGQFVARGATPANPLYVADVAGGLGGAGGAGGKLGGILKFVGALGLATIALELWQNSLVPLNQDIADMTTSIDKGVKAGLDSVSDKQLEIQRDALAEGLEKVLATTQGLGPLQGVLFGSQIEGLKADLALVNAELTRRGVSPDERQARNDLLKLVQSTDDRGRETTAALTGIDVTLTAMQKQLHADLAAAVDVLRTSNDPAAIAAAVAGVVAAVQGGAGSAGTTQGAIGALTAQRDAALASGNTELAKTIAAAIAQLEPFAKGRQWQAEQIAEARKIVASNATTAEKVAALKGIQADLLSHQRTMAAGIVGKLLDVEKAVNKVRIPSPTIISQIIGGGGPTPPKAPPKAPVPARNYSPHRASGGPVTAGRPYLVGERGTELFVPSARGGIVSNPDIAGLSTGSTTINNNVQVQGLLRARDPFEVASQLRRLANFGVLTPRKEPA